MTPEEKEILDALVLAWNKFIELEQTHPNDVKEFGTCISRCQKTIGMRILRRDYPDEFPTYKLEKGEK